MLPANVCRPATAAGEPELPMSTWSVAVALLASLAMAGPGTAQTVLDQFQVIGKQAFSPPLANGWATAGDMDGDGYADVVLAPNSGRPEIYRNDHQGRFARTAVLPAFGSWDLPVLADVD